MSKRILINYPAVWIVRVLFNPHPWHMHLSEENEQLETINSNRLAACHLDNCLSGSFLEDILNRLN